MGQAALIMIGGMMLLLILMGLFFVSRYIKVPVGKILVIYGRTGDGDVMTLAGGAAFVWPVIQAYEFLDLTTHEINIDNRFLTKNNTKFQAKLRIAFGISNREGLMRNAAERLLGLETPQIKDVATDIMLGMIRQSFATFDLVNIASDKDAILNDMAMRINNELNKAGLQLINLNLEFPKSGNDHLKAIEQKLKEKLASSFSFEVGDADEIQKQLEILNDKIEANANERTALIEEKLNFLVKWRS